MASLHNICCVCLLKSEILNDVNQRDDQDTTCIYKLTSCVPELKWLTYFKICQNCLRSLDEAYNFIQQCIKNHELREALLKVHIKDEVSVTTEIKMEKGTDNIFTCDLCGKSYKNKTTLKTHINKKHQIVKEIEIEVKSDSEPDLNLDNSNDKDFDVPLSVLRGNEEYLNDPRIEYELELKQEDSEEEQIKKIKKVRKEKKKETEKDTVRLKRGRRKVGELGESPPPKRKKVKLPVSCEYCQKVFNHRQTYELHVRTNHTFEKPYECDLCPAKFVRNQNLMIHKRSHTNERPYICDTCGKDFASSGNLSHHSKIHLNKREYQCDMCNKSFNKSGNLSAHKMVVHSDPADWKFICQVCGKKFPVKGGLVLHMQRHVGKKEDVCHVCKKEFLNKYELKRHMLSHSSDQTFECTVCNQKTFKTKYGLRRHLAFTHNIGKVKYWKAEKKYACHVCPKLFTNNFKLKKHLTTHQQPHEKPFSNQPIIHHGGQHHGFVPPNFA